MVLLFLIQAFCEFNVLSVFYTPLFCIVLREDVTYPFRAWGMLS